MIKTPFLAVFSLVAAFNLGGCASVGPEHMVITGVSVPQQTWGYSARSTPVVIHCTDCRY